MEHQDLPPLASRGALNTVGSTCFISAKHTGVATLIIQFIILLVSALTVLFFFYHVGGYEYMGWNENSTILEPVYNHGKHLISSSRELHDDESTEEEHIIRHGRELSDAVDNSINKVREFFNDTAEDIRNLTENIVDSTIGDADNDTETIYIPDTFIRIMDQELDMLEMIRISTLAYIVLALLWLISLGLLLFSIKYEVIDMVVINSICLTAAVMYLFIHAIFIAVLLYYQRELHWRSMLIVIGSAVILFCTVALGAVCLALVIGWYKYITYMNDGEKCYCIALCVGIIKGERQEMHPRAQEYAMRDAGRNPQEISYAEPPIQNFSSF